MFDLILVSDVLSARIAVLLYNTAILTVQPSARKCLSLCSAASGSIIQLPGYIMKLPGSITKLPYSITKLSGNKRTRTIVKCCRKIANAIEATTSLLIFFP